MTIRFSSFFYALLTVALFLEFFSKSLHAQDHHDEFQKKSDKLESCAIVIFGASGDLTAKKLFPALYHLSLEKHLTNSSAIIGFARAPYNDQKFREYGIKSIQQFFKNYQKDSFFEDRFQKSLFYVQADFQDDKGYEKLKETLENTDRELGTNGNRLYYLAVAPSNFSIILKKLHEHHLLDQINKKNWCRVIIEKPFGHDLESACRLQNEISTYLDENQIYRIDHYLGKEGVQSLFTLRFESCLFEPIWNYHYIDNIQITLAEDIGISTRARFWEETGTLRDVVQNHVMQLLAIIAMEPPLSFDATNIHKERLKVLESIRPFKLTEIDLQLIRAQYTSGFLNEKKVPGYFQEHGVSKDSLAETYIATKIFIDNSRWKDVPFYIRGGKRLAKQVTEIAITFKNQQPSIDLNQLNVLFIRIQPNPGIFLKTLTKVPMLHKVTKPIIFGYNPDIFFGKTTPDAYEKLIYDCILGDRTLYVEWNEQLAAWRLFTPILDYWKKNIDTKLELYEAGTWGPSTADQMLLENGHHWHLMHDVNN